MYQINTWYTLNLQDVLCQLYLNNDGGESREEEPFTGFYKQFSVIKNIHAGLVNHWDKSMDNSSSGLCRCL